MKFFIDTANLDQIREAQALGILDGVTTNPSLMAKEGIAGDAAVKAELGRAQSEALAALYGAWTAAGDKAREVFLIQQIDEILQDVAKVTDGLTVDHVNIIDGGDGRSLSRYVGAYPAVVTELLARIKETVGVDVAGIVTSSNPPPSNTPTGGTQ